MHAASNEDAQSLQARIPLESKFLQSKKQSIQRGMYVTKQPFHNQLELKRKNKSPIPEDREFNKTSMESSPAR